MNLLRLSVWLSLACASLQLACCRPCADASTAPTAPAPAPANERTIVAIQSVLERAALAELQVGSLPAHPETVAKQAAIEALQAREAELAAAGEPLDAAVAQSEIARAAVETRSRLAEQETILGPEHPDIQRLRARLDVLDAALAAWASLAANAPANTED
jgi:hypothetical protein